MYDESVVVLGADDVQSPPSSAGLSAKSGQKDRSEGLEHTSHWPRSDHGVLTRQLSTQSDGSEDDEDNDDVRAPTIQGCYDPSEYDDLPVPEDVKDIFSYIVKYIPQNVELENKLCPFLPDFIPAVGDVDSFLKVSRPDGKQCTLGLTVLDEPCTQQSDPAVLQLQLRAVAKQASSKTVVVKKIEDAEKNGKAIDKWIKAINDLHRAKPTPTINYSKPMPNTDNLLQEWPAKVEEQLNNISIVSHDLDCDLSTYATIICTLLIDKICKKPNLINAQEFITPFYIFDIPVYESKIQSLQAFFNLYSTMKNTKGQLLQSQNSTSPF